MSLNIFRLLHAHHQELTTTLTASGFTLERGGSGVVGRGPVRTDHDQQQFYFHVRTVNQRLLLQLIGF
jgi:hypothetical protein